MAGCKWLPDLIECKNWAEYEKYINRIYQIFLHDFVDSQPVFEGKTVRIRYQPKIDGRIQAFYHITSTEYQKETDRNLDAKRCSRIKWPRSFIENYRCDPSGCIDCKGIKYWEEPYGSNQRIYLLFEKEMYVVILERRPDYILLITAYYLDYPHSLRKLLKRYNQYEKAKLKTEGASFYRTPPGTPSTTGR